MKSVTTLRAPLPTLTWARALDYVELTKPRIAVLVLFTVAAGYWLASGAELELAGLLHTVLATALVAAGASALNQFLERHSDALMRRTEHRPLPAGRLLPIEALLFGLALGIGGLIYLAVAIRQPLAVLVAALTFAGYVFLYTPLKRKTTLNTLVGAVPGALPPVIGCTAATGSFSAEALVLFAILFLWQVPHFLAIAWIYRAEYARAGLRMLPVVDPCGTLTGRRMVGYCLALLLVTLLPVALRQAGVFYLLGALVLGIGFLRATFDFSRETSHAQARRVLRASLIYLPLLLALLLLQGATDTVVLAWHP
jgi:protoheme IX farnesyltransferase